jgi:hypothetical protein
MLAALGGCMPMVLHSPRVDRGLGAQLTTGVNLTGCGTRSGEGASRPECPRSLEPMTGVAFSYGFAPRDSARPALLVTAAFPVMDPVAPAADVYVQAPRAGHERARGGGVLFSSRMVMPYVQYGHVTLGDARGWYTTQGVVVTAYVPDVSGDTDPEYLSDGVYAVYWAPTVAYRIANGFGASDLYASAALGRFRPRAFVSTPTGTQRSSGRARLLAGLRIGATLDVHHLPWGPPRTPGCARSRFC